MGLSQQLADFARNVANAPDGPKKAALLAKVHEVTMALREYQVDLVVQASPRVAVNTPGQGRDAMTTEAAPTDRFFNITSFSLAELMPKELMAQGGDYRDPLFILLDDLRMRSDIAGGVILSRQGRRTDLASIPWPLWWFMDPDDPRIAAGAVIHDELCDDKGDITLEDGRHVHLSSTEAARILAFEAMADLGASKLRQMLTFWAVNTFGPHWS